MNKWDSSTAMDLETIKQWIRILVGAGDAHELQALNPGGRGTDRGYFTDPQKMAEAIADLSGEAEGVYMTLNPCDPALLARANNHVKDDAGNPTRDRDIVRRLWFLIDIDPDRPAGVSSSDPEKRAAKVKARDVRAYLSQCGWPQPIPLDSGNGYQLRYRIDLPNDEETTQLVKRCLQVLAARFDDAGVKVDASVFNASCIAMVPGSLAAKGDDTQDRPDRITGLMKFNSEDVSVVSIELLQALAAEAPKEEQAAPEEQRFDELVNSPSDRSDMETKKRTIAKNSDNDFLLPSGNERFVVGYVEEVNGAGAKEIAGYIPTRHELIQLVKYWYGQFLDLEWSFFTTGQTGSYEIRLGPFAERRINRAATAIGEGAVKQAIKEVRDEFKAKVDDARLWDIFENGDSGQWAAVQDEWMREELEQGATDALGRLEQLEKESPGDFIALVLRADASDKSRAVLISPTDSELNAVLQASGQFEIVTDRSRFRALMLDQHFQHMGFLWAARHNGEWMFEFADSNPGTIGWHFLEWVADQIKKLLHADTGKESQPV